MEFMTYKVDSMQSPSVLCDTDQDAQMKPMQSMSDDDHEYLPVEVNILSKKINRHISTLVYQMMIKTFCMRGLKPLNENVR